MKKSSSIKKAVNVVALLVVISICAVKVYADWSWQTGQNLYTEGWNYYNYRGKDSSNGHAFLNVAPTSSTGLGEIAVVNSAITHGLVMSYDNSNGKMAMREWSIGGGYEDKIVFETDGDICIVLQ